MSPPGHEDSLVSWSSTFPFPGPHARKALVIGHLGIVQFCRIAYIVGTKLCTLVPLNIRPRLVRR